jgi:hypothetical protein
VEWVAQWKPLAGELEPAVRRMVVSLRTVKDQAGISTTALASKTPYSRSTWDRYFNGRAFPPRGAVAALVRLAGADEARLLAEWELAESAHTQSPTLLADPVDADDACRAGGAAGGDGMAGAAGVSGAAGGDGMSSADGAAGGPGTGGGPPGAVGGLGGDGGSAVAGVRVRVLGWRRWGVVVAVAGAVAAVTVGVIWLSGGSRPGSTAAPAPAAVRAPDLGCHFSRTGGRFYAGHSTTSDRLVALNAGGQDVVEVQCLLKRHGVDPGRVDGLFGQHTQQAVEQFQRADGAVVDGIVGPQTWALLRG